MSRSSKSSSIEQEVIISGATPAMVFDVLMDESKHARLTGGEARIDRRVGGAFTTFDGWASGVTLEVVRGEKIVQTWRADDWPAGVESVCTYLLSPTPAGTKVAFRQTNVPKSFVSTIAKGWERYYWRPLKKMFS